MRFEMKNGLLVPKNEAPAIVVFLDETYLLKESGFLQAAVPIPLNVYAGELIPLCKELLGKLGKDAKEFKGSAIKPGNRDVYLQFLRHYTNASANVGDKVELYPVVAVDAADQYTGDKFKWVFDNVVGGLKNLGIDNEENLIAEFSRQVLWLFHHWKKISTVRYANPLVLLFDNKHRYAEKFNEQRAVINDKLIAPTFWELGKTMTSFANTLFSMMEPRIPIPCISRLDFQWSPSDFGLQAADVFSHLIYNALKCEMGIKDEGADLKYELLLHVMPDFKLDSPLQTALKVEKDNDGRDGLVCVEPKLLSTFQFLPG